MKKILFTSLVISAVALNSTVSMAQAFQKGDNLIGFGIGFGGSHYNYAYSSQTPSLSLQYENATWAVGGPGVISLGGLIGYKSYTYDGIGPHIKGYPPGVNYTYSEKWSYTIIGLRSAYHFNMINSNEWDLYAGLMLSYNIVNYEFTSNYYDPYYLAYYSGNYDNRMYLSFYLGARYFVSSKFALYSELGYGISSFTIGGAFKF